MRYSYGNTDEKEILLYKPQIFLKSKDLLFFPSTDFHKWYGSIKEYIDSLYQIDALQMEKGKSINITELNLAMGLLNSITEEFEHVFDSEKAPNFHYISTLDEEYKKQKSFYTSDMKRCDTKIPMITPEMKHKHLMEIIDEASRENSHARPEITTRRLSRDE
jgi:hypothetical protein